jgi:hypothetical protein
MQGWTLAACKEEEKKTILFLCCLHTSLRSKSKLRVVMEKDDHLSCCITPNNGRFEVNDQSK